MEKLICKAFSLKFSSHNLPDGAWFWLAGFFVVIFLELPTALAQSIDGTIVRPRFEGSLSDETIRFNMYLPSGYESGTDHYAVVYHLHGRGGGRSDNNRLVASLAEQALEAAELPPVIVVFPDGGSNSWWSDSKSGRTMSETQVIRELIPYVDANYRTKPSRGYRGVQGFSMGGAGAIMYLLKFPELFSVGVSYDGALQTWDTLRQRQGDAASRMFSMDEAYFNEYSPWFNAARYSYYTMAEEFPVALYMVGGQLLPLNREFRDYLTRLELPATYEEANCDHNLGCLSRHGDLLGYRFIGDHFVD